MHHLYTAMTRGLNCIQEKPKEKTVFNVMLKSFDAGAKPKVIREVKALVPNLTLIDVRPVHVWLAHTSTYMIVGKEVCGIRTKGPQGEPFERGRREAQENFRSIGGCR